MKERIQPHYPTASEAAAEEKRLQLELALLFDAHEYRVGDQVTWLVPHDYVEGKGELIAIGEVIELVGEAEQRRPKWGGSLYVRLSITESSRLRPKRKGTSYAGDLALTVPDRYAPGRCIELKKHQVTGRSRKRVI